MLINKNCSIVSPRVLLVPYSPHHVPTYHEWMKDTEIQEATASEPLSLEEEYSMQRSWREDSDKLTFISCLPPLYTSKSLGSDDKDTASTTPHQDDSPDRMIGDVNLFLKLQENDNLRPDNYNNQDEANSAEVVVAELELMVAQKHHQRKGLGRASLLCFLKYVVCHTKEILEEFLAHKATDTKRAITDTPNSVDQYRFEYLMVRIGAENKRSIALFESLGFIKVTDQPNVFGELELRKFGLGLEEIDGWFHQYGIEGYKELPYELDQVEVKIVG
ncbi:hypothetical protein FQN57_000982 [Myotisia sp. PD_48]|nr:hypothetical protein FQN57_000982 [Myotisia sp. PD_48]